MDKSKFSEFKPNQNGPFLLLTSLEDIKSSVY